MSHPFIMPVAAAGGGTGTVDKLVASVREDRIEMPNPSGPDEGRASERTAPHQPTGEPNAPVGPDDSAPATEIIAPVIIDAATEIIGPPLTDPAISHPDPAEAAAGSTGPAAERRFTAPSGFDAGKTQVMQTAADPATEVMPAAALAAARAAHPITAAEPAAPQAIPGRDRAAARGPRRRRSWGWVIALVLVIAALAAVAILGTVLLTRRDASSMPAPGVAAVLAPATVPSAPVGE